MILMNSSLGLVNLGFKVFSSITDEFKRHKKYIMMIAMTMHAKHNIFRAPLFMLVTQQNKILGNKIIIV